MNLPVEQTKFVEFLLRAMSKCWAGDGKDIDNPQRPGFKELEYCEGDFVYRYSYVGYYFAPGQEVVRFQGIPIWSMSYSGGMNPEYHEDRVLTKRVFAFLKEVLLQVDPSRPFRGPNFYVGKDEFEGLRYIDHSIGNVLRFNGRESILVEKIDKTIHQKEVFSQDYIGCLMVYK